MGEKTLVDALVTDSIELVQRLDSTGMSPSFVVWYFYEDADQWKFLIAGPEFDKFLPKNEPRAYQKVSETISSANLGSLSISLVKIIPSSHPLAQAISPLFGTDPKVIARMHFSDTTLNGIFIKEMFILRSAISRKT